MIKIELSGKVGKGKFIIIDEADFERVNQYKWYLSKTHNKKSYAVNGMYHPETQKSYGISLHRFLIKTNKGEQIDHINGDGLDNRRCNLRICNNLQNNQNKGPQKNNKLGLKGVHIDDRNKYHVTIQVPNGKYKFLGRYNCPTIAALAYDNAARKYFGEFAYLNYK